MSETAIDLDAYFERIGYSGPRTATLDTLKAIHALHPAAIAFENLTPLMGRPVLLDTASLERKLIHEKRGGYCYEQNTLLWRALTALGFRTAGLAARVLWNRPDDALTPRTHMLLRVEIDGEDYIADVGFGGQSLTAPLRLQADVEQSTPHEPHRLIRVADEFKLQANIRGAWRTIYRFDLTENLPADYEIVNYYIASHPDSYFRSSLIAARALPERRYALMNTQLAIHHLGGESERRALNGTSELLRTLEDLFGLTLPETPELDAALARVAG